VVGVTFQNSSAEHGSSSQITETPTWSPASKIAARYLAPYLEEYDRLARSNA
jgi:hypothetical protein